MSTSSSSPLDSKAIDRVQETLMELQGYATGKTKTPPHLDVTVSSLFSRYLVELKSAAELFKTYLEREWKREDLNPDEMKKYCATMEWLCAWAQWLRPYQKLTIEQRSRLCSTYKQDETKIFFTQATFNQEPFKKYFCFLRLRQPTQDLSHSSGTATYLQNNLPFNCLKTIYVDRQPVAEEKKKAMDEWLTTVMKQFSVRKFHRFLTSLYRALGLRDKEVMETEYALYKVWENKAAVQGVKEGPFLSLPDPKHLKWRKDLKLGDRVQCCGKTCTLVEQLSSGDNVYYRIQESTDLLWIGVNTVLGGLRKISSLEQGLAIPRGPIHEVDMDRGCSLVEYLPHDLKTFKGSEDNFTQWIQFFVDNECSPSVTAPHKIRRNSEGKPRSLDYAPFEELNVITLEGLVYYVADGDLDFYQRVMKATGLGKQAASFFDFFEGIVRFAALELEARNSEVEEKKIKDLGNKKTMTNPVARERGALLMADVFEKVGKLKQQEKEEFVKKYVQQKVLGRIWIGK